MQASDAVVTTVHEQDAAVRIHNQCFGAVQQGTAIITITESGISLADDGFYMQHGLARLGSYPPNRVVTGISLVGVTRNRKPNLT